MMDGYDLTILIGAVPRGGAPEALYVIEPDLNKLNEPGGNTKWAVSGQWAVRLSSGPNVHELPAAH